VTLETRRYCACATQDLLRDGAGERNARAVDEVSFDLYPGETSHRGRIGLRENRHVAVHSPTDSRAPRPHSPGSLIEFEAVTSSPLRT